MMGYKDKPCNEASVVFPKRRDSKGLFIIAPSFETLNSPADCLAPQDERKSSPLQKHIPSAAAAVLYMGLGVSRD